MRRGAGFGSPSKLMRANALFARSTSPAAKRQEHREMPIVILVCSVLLIAAVGYQLYTSEYPPGALIERLQTSQNDPDLPHLPADEH